jgi:hypothetical protein
MKTLERVLESLSRFVILRPRLMLYFFVVLIFLWTMPGGHK